MQSLHISQTQDCFFSNFAIRMDAFNCEMLITAIMMVAYSLLRVVLVMGLEFLFLLFHVAFLSFVKDFHTCGWVAIITLFVNWLTTALMRPCMLPMNEVQSWSVSMFDFEKSIFHM